MTFGLPILVFTLIFSCNDVSGCPAPSLLNPKSLTLDKLAQDVAWPGFAGLVNWQASIAVVAYYALTFVFYGVLPAQIVEGGPLPNSGVKLTYRFNSESLRWHLSPCRLTSDTGFTTSMAFLAILGVGTAVYGASFPVYTFIWDNYIQIISANMLIAFGLATYVYVNSFSIRPGKPTVPPHRELAAGGISGSVIYDWFMGRELNPPVWIPGLGYVEIKTYMELRPGMTGWMILAIAFAAKQYQNYGRFTDAMLLVTAGELMYILDAHWNESSILQQIDITTDGFGFMLAFGDLAWLPFVYSLQGRYLAVHPVNLGVFGVVGVLTVQGLGYYIFRASNGQKTVFRMQPNDPSVRNLSYIQTKHGSKLLTSGWWGAARHINYLGDWIMSWSWSLPTGIAGYVIQDSFPFRSNAGLAKDKASLIRNDQSLTGGKEVMPGDARGWGMVITYFYLLYFAVLLIHRERRDDEKCQRKYGKDWDEYKRQVPSRIVPGIY